jgi:hypothetical protein
MQDTSTAKPCPGLVHHDPDAPNNLLVFSGGALGDWGYCVPALNVLRNLYDQIWVVCRERGRLALGDTGLVDEFVIIPEGYNVLSEKDQRAWYDDVYLKSVPEFRVNITPDACLINRLTFKRDHPGFNKSSKWKRSLNSGKNWFDEVSRWLGVPVAVGRRPITRHTAEEREFLYKFRSEHNIPGDAFLLGWQFIGSGETKWYPHFKEVIQEGIMSRHDDVYLVGMGDLKNKLKWGSGRFINLADSITFRQAYLLTDVFDLLVGPDTGVMVFSQGYPDTPKILLASLTGGHHLKCGSETRIVKSDAKCAPCWNIISKCKYDGDQRWQHCMGKLQPKKVIQAIEGAIRTWRQGKIIQIAR